MYYKLANMCYKLYNTRYKVCNKLFLRREQKISEGLGKLSGRKRKTSALKEEFAWK